MKKAFVIPALLVLSACVQSQADYRTGQESKLWAKARAQSAVECSAYKSSDRAQAVQADACVAGIVRHTVLSRAAFPDLVVKLIEDQSAVSHKFADGSIDRKQADAEARQLQARYQASVMKRWVGE